MSWWATARAQLALLLLLVGASLGIAVYGVWRRLRHSTVGRQPGLPTAFGAAAFLYISAVAVALALVDPFAFQFGVPSPIVALLAASFPLVILGLATIASGLLAMRRDSTHRIVRGSAAVLAAAVLLFLTHWNLIAFQF